MLSNLNGKIMAALNFTNSYRENLPGSEQSKHHLTGQPQKSCKRIYLPVHFPSQKLVVKMKYNFYILVLAVFSSCTAARVSVPDSFRKEATEMSVKGLQGWQVNQRVSFGNFQTSKIKRGWDFSSSLQHTKFLLRPEEALMKVFDIDTDRKSANQRNRFQYSLEDGNLVTEIYAAEKFNEKLLVYKSRNPWIGEVSKMNSYEYSFSAAIVPLNLTDRQPWSFLLRNTYDRRKDTARGIFDRPYVEEEGYATNGTENIYVRPLRIEKLTTKSGRDTKVLGGKLFSGYEILWDEGLVGIVDILDNKVWIYNDLEAADKIIVSSIASALLLKRMKDVEQDKDALFE